MSEEILAIMPRIYDAGGDLKKQWSVFYSYRNPKTGKMQRFKITQGINQHSTKKARYAVCQKIINKYQRKLNNGYNPFEAKQLLYADTLSYVKNQGKPYQVQSKNFDFSIEQYLSDALADHKNNVRPSTFQAYQTHLRMFTQWLNEQAYAQLELDEFGTEHAQKFLNSLELHNKTRWAYRTNLKRFWNFLIKRGYIQENPWNNTELPVAETTKAKRAFRSIEQKRIKNYCQEHQLIEIWTVIQFLFYCFIRPGELRNLKVSDIDLDSKKILMRSEISKNKKRQYITIPKPFLPALEEYLITRQPKDYVFGVAGKRRGEEYFYRKHRDVLKALGFGQDVSLYSWKHTGAVEFYRHTKDIQALQQQLRHSSLDEVNTYLHSLGLIENDIAKNNFPEL